jgi:hypothetical protein
MPAGKRPQAVESAADYFRDYGGDSRGRAVKKAGATQGVCTGCGRYQFVSRLGWRRKTRPTCSSCGSLLEPSKKAQRQSHYLKSEPPPLSCRRCTNCNAILRDGNTAEQCSPCQQNPDWLTRSGSR